MLKIMLGFAAGVMVMLAIVSGQVIQDNPDARVYCEMRKIFDDTNGDFGWPNYRSEIECTNGEVK
jgi:hypothetical protein